MCERINGRKNASSAGCRNDRETWLRCRCWGQCVTIRPSNEWNCRHGIIFQADNGLQNDQDVLWPSCGLRLLINDNQDFIFALMIVLFLQASAFFQADRFADDTRLWPIIFSIAITVAYKNKRRKRSRTTESISVKRRIPTSISRASSEFRQLGNCSS